MIKTLYFQRHLSLEKYIAKQFVHQSHETLQNSQQYMLLLSQLVKPALTSHACDILLVQDWHAILHNNDYQLQLHIQISW